MDFYRTAMPWNMLLRPYGPGFRIGAWLWNHHGHLHHDRHRGEKIIARTISKFTNGTLLHPNSDPFYDGHRAKNFSPLQVPNHLIS
jgi:hypothetical protein